MVQHRCDVESKSHWVFRLGPKINGVYPEAGAYCKVYGQRNGQASWRHFRAETQRARTQHKTVTERSSRNENSRTGKILPGRSRAARKTTAARKANTVVDRRTPGAKRGRHAK